MKVKLQATFPWNDQVIEADSMKEIYDEVLKAVEIYMWETGMMHEVSNTERITKLLEGRELLEQEVLDTVVAIKCK